MRLARFIYSKYVYTVRLTDIKEVPRVRVVIILSRRGDLFPRRSPPVSRHRSFVLWWSVIIYRLGDRPDFFAQLRDSHWHGACFRIDGQRRSFVRLLASITETAAESLTVTDGIQGDPVSHRTRLNQPQVAACSATIIDWLSMYSLTNIYRLIGNARHIVLAAARDSVPRLLSIDPFII